MIPGFQPYSIHDAEYPNRIYTVQQQCEALSTRMSPSRPNLSNSFWFNKDIPRGVSRDEMQRVQNHIHALKEAYEQTHLKGVFLIEDTVEVIGDLSSIRQYIDDARRVTRGSWDLLLLGAEQMPRKQAITHRVERAYSFKNPYAFYLRRECIQQVLTAFMEHISNGYFPTIDFLYRDTARHCGWVVLGPWKSDVFVKPLGL
jgi:hypothetical protein